MKLRNLLVLAGLVAAMVPVGAQASHCDSPIYIFSRHRLPGGPYDDPRGGKLTFAPTAVSSTVGCNVHEALTPDDPHEATETDLIYPGADALGVRLLNNADEASVLSATLTYAGQTYDLTMTNTTDITGAAATFLDSQTIAVDPADSLEANEAVATICVDGEDECFVRTYRTVA